MAGQRVVSVTLKAQVAEYKRGMLEAAQATRTVGTEGEKLAQMREAFEGVGRAATVMGGLLTAAAAIAIKKAADFDEAMSNVGAATNETAANMDLLRQAAIDFGASTVYNAEEAAGAIEELAKAGVSTADILGGALAGSLDLAAAGQLGVARAAEITSTALNQFGLSGSDATHVSDVLAAGAGKAMGSVDDLANGLKFVGPVAAAMGVSLEETTGALALFAQQGIIGEQAGTSLRGVLSSLTAPSSQARAEIERLGLSLYDSQGNFLGLENAAGQLSKAYSNMDGASRDASLGIIFGRETITAATALYKAGAPGVDDWTKAVDDSGYAAEQARKRLDNMKGDLEALGGAFDSALIQSGSAANDSLRALIQSLTGLVDMFNGLPEPVQEATLMLGGATGAIVLAGGAAFSIVPKFLEMQSTVRAAGLSMSSLSLSAGAAGAALAGMLIILGEAARLHAEAQANAKAYADTLEDGTNRATNATRQLAQENLAAERSMFWMNRGSAYDAAEKLGISLETVTDAATGNVAALKELEDVLKAGGGEMDAAQRVSEKYGVSLGTVSSLTSVLSEAVLGENKSLESAIRINEQKEAATRGVADANGEASSTASTAASAYLEEAGSVSSVRDELDRLIKTVNDANGANQNAITANVDYQNALAGVDDRIQKIRDGVKGYAQSLDTGTQAGRDNTDALIDLARQAQDAAQQQYALDGNTEAYRQTLENSRQALIDRATELGGNADQARALADQIFRIPSDTEWKVIAQTRDAQGDLERFISLNSGRQIPLRISASGIESIRLPNGMTASSNANGGLYSYGSAFADGGGVDTGIYAGRAGSIHKFAEPETVWEAYISGKPDQRNRNVGIWQETGRRLGIEQQSGPSSVTNVSQVYNVPQGPTADQLLRAAREDAAWAARSES